MAILLCCVVLEGCPRSVVEENVLRIISTTASKVLFAE